MISTNQYSLSWEHFEDIHEDKRKVFEMLCRSLFMRNRALETDILHSDPNHPGVEVAPVHSRDGNELVSFQAKYFDQRVNYRDIESSIDTTIRKYSGKIDKVFLYCNKDIKCESDSFLQINKKAVSAKIEIVPITGQSILDEVMEYPPLLSCYFGLDSLDNAWFETNLRISLDDLGQRYNSAFNIETKAQEDLELFLRSDFGVCEINNKKKEAISELENLKWRSDSEFKNFISLMISAIKGIEDVTAASIMDSLQWKEMFIKNNEETFSFLNEMENNIEGKLQETQRGNSEYYELRNKLYFVHRLSRIPEILGLSETEKTLITKQILIITGEMGVGKSQLLASSARTLIEQGNPSLLLLGQTYITEDPIEIQIVNGLAGINANESLESILGVMSEKAYLNNQYAVIYIDAINEMRYKNVWKTCDNRLLTTIQQYNNILLVISIRDGFEPLLFSEKVNENIKSGDIAVIKHRGLENDTPQEVFDFLSHYGISVSPDYYLQREMSNPLYLMWFCQTFTNEERELETLINKVLEKADKEASEAAGYGEPLRMLKKLLIEYIENSESGFATIDYILNLKAWDRYGVTNKTAYLKAIERAGVFVTHIRNGEELYYIGYNLLEDYIHANWIVEKMSSKEEVINYCKQSLLGIDVNGRVSKVENTSVFAMLTALYAIKYNEECFDIIDAVSDDNDKQYIVDECFKTFLWRTPRVSFAGYIDLLNHFHIEPGDVWGIFIENATKENSILNANGLSQLLKTYPLNKRDYLWSTYVNELSEYDRIVSLAYYIEAGNDFNVQSENKIKLLLTLYSWMLSSSNRVLRDRISKAMIEILKTHLNLCQELLLDFQDVNDPYIIQRLYGIVFGAVMKRQNEDMEVYESLALFVYTNIFMGDKVYPDILLRDYARLIIERYIFEFPEKAELFDESIIKPPYKSEPIPTVEAVDYGEEKYHEGGMYRLLFSMKFDSDVKGIGMYGDFGRYIFQSAIHHFADVNEQNIYYYAVWFILDKLGYSNELFSDYDTRMADFDRNQLRHIERIGKKYEWITLYNILARLSDTCYIEDWSDQRCSFKGAWELSVRDFDPTLNTRYHVNPNMFPVFTDETIDGKRFIDRDSNDETIKRWIIEDDDMYSSLPSRIIRTDMSGNQWVSLYLHQEIKRKGDTTKEFVFGYPKGEQHIWAISSLQIMKDKAIPTVDSLHSSEYIRKNHGMSLIDSYSGLFAHEYPWSCGFVAVSNEEGDEDEKCEIEADPAVINVLWESQYDSSQDTTTSYLIPSERIIQALDLREKDLYGVFYHNNEIAAFDTCILGDEYGELLLRKDLFDTFITNNNAVVFWEVVGEKQFFLGDPNHNQAWQRREGYYLYNNGQLNGDVRIVPNI